MSVAVADGSRQLTDALTRYYTEKGTPPGFWLGSAVRDIGGGLLVPFREVSEAHLRLLLGLGCDPVTGEPLGRAWPVYRGVTERIAARVSALDKTLGWEARAEAITAIETAERDRGARRAVAGYDYTFSVPKSVSVLWAVADGGTQALIARAHHTAVSEVLDLMERHVAVTRVGADAGDGSIVHMDVTGLVATAYDHYDSRAGDPQLHTHVVVANKVKAVHDGGWRTLAGRPMHQAVVALSEHYNAVLADHLARDLGLGWEVRDRGERRNPAFELAVVPDALVEEFSRRSHDIEARTDELITDYRRQHGRDPSTRTILRLRAQATLATRPDKEVRSLGELTEGWRQRATRRLGEDSTGWATGLIAGAGRVAGLRADDVPLDAIGDLGQSVVVTVGQKRATWRRWNLHAEASRQTMTWRFASTIDREAVVGLIVDAAEHHSLQLTPPELASSPVVFRRADGTSMFRPKHGTVFSATGLLEAEDRMLALGQDTSAPSVDLAVVGRVARRSLPGGHRLSPDQTSAVALIALSGRVVDLLVGPAGTGKTTTLGALRAAWERQHGAGSVVGLTPSAAAAEVLAGDLGIGTENTAKWLYEHRRNGLALRRGQLLILDEASLAGTLTLDEIASHAAEVGAKVLLAGDPAQLDAVEAGGVFGLLVREHGGAATLEEVRRFRHAWEKDASLRLRLGDASVLEEYEGHGRVVGGDAETVMDALYEGWRADVDAGLVSVMIAETAEAVGELNGRARLDRILDGQVDPAAAVRLVDGSEASAGDLVLTRNNDRRLSTGRQWVKNGDRWQVVTGHTDGSLTVRRDQPRGGLLRLPAWYVAEHVELAYAVTAHRAQGSTVDTAHSLVRAPSMAREVFYVAMTRGRESNTCYVVTDQPSLEDHQLSPNELGAREVLAAVLSHVAAEPSVHEAIETEQDAWAGIRQLAAEYETIAATALADRYFTLLERAGLNTGQLDDLAAGDSFPPLAAELRRLEAEHRDLDQLLARVLQARSLDDADDLGAILLTRLRHATAPSTGSTRGRAPRMIAGLIPEATGPMPADARHALVERKHLIETRAEALTHTAIAEQAPWTRTLGTPPTEGAALVAWLRQVRIVAAYRDRHRVTADTPLGPEPDGAAQRLDRARAAGALRAATRIRIPAPAGRTQQQSRQRTGPTL
ncbi:MAG: relaxase domain-containing protein [Salinibacterium sp.]|nr:relaxase domain-containing protein [Salinibacterium sp.]